MFGLRLSVGIKASPIQVCFVAQYQIHVEMTLAAFRAGTVVSLDTGQHSFLAMLKSFTSL